MDLVSAALGGAVSGLTIVAFLITHSSCTARKGHHGQFTWGMGFNEVGDLKSQGSVVSLVDRLESLEANMSKLVAAQVSLFPAVVGHIDANTP